MDGSPFESVESAQRYVGLLAEAVINAQEDIRDDLAEAAAANTQRHVEALRLVDHKLNELRVHLRATSRILNDLRMLRRILFARPDGD